MFDLHLDGVFVQHKEVIAWLRVREFQLLSLRMICHQMLRTSPHYSALEAGHAPVDLEAESPMSRYDKAKDKVVRAKDKAKQYRAKADVLRSKAQRELQSRAMGGKQKASASTDDEGGRPRFFLGGITPPLAPALCCRPNRLTLVKKRDTCM